MNPRRRSRIARAREDGPVLFPPGRGEELLDTRVIAGVDEAGFGPLLGPLTIGWSAFRVPAPKADLWRELSAVVSRDPRDDADRLVVADSKVVFERNERGARRLETTALAFLALLDPARRWPASGAELLARLASGVDTEVALASQPWFPHLPERLPQRADPGGLAELVGRLDRATLGCGIALADLGARVLPVEELNASFSATQSKGRTHWEMSAPVFARLWGEHGREGLELLVDRHGGRKRYAALLIESLPDARVSVRSEAPSRSEYTAVSRDRQRSMRIAFAEKADRSSFPVALASCLAKYAREACMDAFNAYFGSLQPGLRPTAGYVTDGRRWLAEAGPAIERSGVQPAGLVRER